MNLQQKIEIASNLLEKLVEILDGNQEHNWIRGAKLSLIYLNNNSDEGFENAASIYRTMISGVGGFSEYYIDGNTPEERMINNYELDDIKSQLWDIFKKI